METTEGRVMLRPGARGIELAIIASIVGHILVVVGLVVIQGWKHHRSNRPQTVLTTKLVRLGQERPKELLPRKEEPPPPPEAPAVAPAAPKETTPTAKQPSAKDRIKEMSKVASALERLKQKNEPVEGHEAGVQDGEVSNVRDAILGSQFATEVYRCLKQNYAVEGVEAGRVKNLHAVVYLRIGGDGAFLEHKVTSSSGMDAFDRAVERAVVRCGKVSPPPQHMREQVREDGFEVEFKP